MLGLAELGIFLLPVVGGSVVAKMTMNDESKKWSESLRQPGWAPPNWIFGPMWTFLYLVLGLVGVRLYRQTKSDGTALMMLLFLAHILLNFLWPFVYFGVRDMYTAREVILAMVLTIVYMMTRFDRTSSVLLIPYLAWVAFAAALNFEIARLNVP